MVRYTLWANGGRHTDSSVRPCLGALAIHVGGAELVASALGPRASVRSFVDSVDLAHASR